MAETADDYSNYPAQRGQGRRKVDRPKINWSAVSVIVAVVLAIFGGVSGWFGANAAEVRQISDRLATLETQRAQDVRQWEIDRAGQAQRMERLEDKIDRLLERVK